MGARCAQTPFPFPASWLTLVLSIQDAAAFTRLTYARDLNVALEHAQRVVTSFSSQELASETAQAAQAVVDRLEVLSKAIWEDVESDDVFGPRCVSLPSLFLPLSTLLTLSFPAHSQEDAQPHIDAVCLDLWRSSSLADMYNPLLERIVEASESTQITQRSKALRAIGLVVAQDPELFHQVRFSRFPPQFEAHSLRCTGKLPSRHRGPYGRCCVLGPRHRHRARRQVRRESARPRRSISPPTR